MDRKLQPWPEFRPTSHLSAYLGSFLPDPKAPGLLDFRTFLLLLLFCICIGRTQLTLVLKFQIQIGGQSLGKGSLHFGPGTGFTPCACQCRAPGSRPGQQRSPNPVLEEEEMGAGQRWWWWGRSPGAWSGIFSFSIPPSATSAFCLNLAVPSIWGQLLAGPNSRPVVCPLPACCQPPGHPSRLTAGPGGHKGAIELRSPGPGCIKALVSSRGSKGRPQA